jgi:shikimate dehydrogenase
MPPDRLAVIGDPIAHSLSPVMQGAALLSASLPWAFEAHHVLPAELAAWVRRAREAAYRGFNVTIPHKVAIASHLDGIASSAERVGAVNTVVRSGEHLIGHNTDLVGFKQALLALAPDVWGVRAVIFGAGGAARAAVHALTDLEARMTIVNRHVVRAASLAEGLDRTTALGADDPRLATEIEDARLLVNATPLGMSHLADCSPLPAGTQLQPDTVVIDLVYGHPTPLLREAARRSCRCADGLEMLVQQGAESFRLWTGLEPDLEAMRAACHAHLKETQVC